MRLIGAGGGWPIYSESVAADDDAFLPLESERENNGSPIMWLVLATALLAGAVGVIVLIGRDRDAVNVADRSSELVTEISGLVTEPTEPSTISPPDEGSEN